MAPKPFKSLKNTAMPRQAPDKKNFYMNVRLGMCNCRGSVSLDSLDVKWYSSVVSKYAYLRWIARLNYRLKSYNIYFIQNIPTFFTLIPSKPNKILVSLHIPQSGQPVCRLRRIYGDKFLSSFCLVFISSLLFSKYTGCISCTWLCQ